MAKRAPRKNEGRPTKYSVKFIKQVEKYLQENVDEVVQVVKQSNSNKGYEMYENKLKVKLPTVEGFALYIGVSKSTVYEWKDIYPEFSDALDRIVEEQRSRLLNSGLSGDYNPTIAKLVLASNHGMSDKQEIDHTSGGQVIKGVGVILDKAYGTDEDDDEGRKTA